MKSKLCFDRPHGYFFIVFVVASRHFLIRIYGKKWPKNRDKRNEIEMKTEKKMDIMTNCFIVCKLYMRRDGKRFYVPILCLTKGLKSFV